MYISENLIVDDQTTNDVVVVGDNCMQIGMN